MKISLIIILLALTGFTYGQGGFDPLRYIDSPTEYSGSIQPRLFTLREMIYNNYDHFIMERYLRREYIEHCYADSSILYEWIHYRWNGMECDTVYQLGQFPMYIESSCKKIPPIYKHTEPTFEGYVEWLEEILTQSDK